MLVQRGLTELKLKVGYTDGLFGKRTRGAIREWQEGKGMEATGYLTEAQAAALVAVGKEAEGAAKEQARLATEAAERERRERDAKVRAAAEMRPGREYRACKESWCPELVVVPAGEYMMGSGFGEGASDERVHVIKVGDSGEG